MPKFMFNKLVRDKIIDHQIASGAKPHYYKLGVRRHQEELVNKIIEDAHEVIAADQNDLAAEIADVQQALDDLKTSFGLVDSDIAKAQAKKNASDGTFQQGIYIDYVEVADSDKWATYYRQHADRYPEID